MVADYSSCWRYYWTGYGHRGRSPSGQLRHWRALRASFWLRQGIYMFFFFVIWYLTLRRFFVLPASTCFFNLCFLDDLRLLKPSEVKAFQGLGTGNRIATWLMYVSANLLTVILFVVFFCLWLWTLCAIGEDRKKKSTPSKIWDGATVLPLGYSTWVLTHLHARKDQCNFFLRYSTTPVELSESINSLFLRATIHVPFQKFLCVLLRLSENCPSELLKYFVLLDGGGGVLAV